MAGIMNNTARQFNLKCMSRNGNRVLVRIAPGFNVVEDDHWGAFVPKNGKVDPYVARLKKSGQIEFGVRMDDLELEKAPDTKSKSKSEPIAKLKADAEKASKEAEFNKLEADKAKAEADKAKVELEAAKVELEAAKVELSKSKTESSENEDKSKK